MDWLSVALVDFVARVSPGWGAPVHLADWCSLIEGCLTGGVRGMVSVPVRH